MLEGASCEVTRRRWYAEMMIARNPLLLQNRIKRMCCGFDDHKMKFYAIAQAAKRMTNRLIFVLQHSEYGNLWFNNRESDDTYYMFRSYNNCYYSSSELVTDEEDEL